MILSGWESVFFWVFAVAALVAGLLTVMARNAVHSALFLISTLISVAALYVLAGAEFIAGVQILVYVGGVMVLFLFVIMLVNVAAEERGREEPFNRPAQVGAAFAVSLLLVLILIISINQGVQGLYARDGRGAEALSVEIRARRTIEDARLERSAAGTSRISEDTGSVGASLYRYGALPFEIASVLLLVAIVGSVLLARTAKQELAADDVAPEVLDRIARDEPEVLTETGSP
ncbi:MAG TPA: NADH-quinone oxidoreductase subunit J [Pyrinomonadaceae bacterium]|nr:NADH-quinone oxidoreductase subunit J [Pyrinomonadaceae bacterium]